MTESTKVAIKAVGPKKYWLKRTCFVKGNVYKVPRNIAKHLLAQTNERGFPMFVPVLLDMEPQPETVKVGDATIVDVDSVDTGKQQVVSEAAEKPNLDLPSFDLPDDPVPVDLDELGSVEVEETLEDGEVEEVIDV